ncbi:hypothetical protein AAG570_003037 [Ranatra chinensis]|uniref:Protein kinase domain-containing protein n=1 Tax=Ranatra chinensis TaxID=642074 RepID=A0ABD0Y5Q0_9HEMI
MMACKVVDTKRMPKGLYEKFLSREMDILTKMRHPNIVHLYRIFRRKYKIFMFMRFAELGNLCDLLTLRGALKEKYARVWSRQLISGLTYLHAIGVVHRDLKCENVLISNNRRVKIADFGFSKFLEKEGDLCSTYCGSLGYSAPEVLEGKPYDGKCADAWSLGVVIYAMLNRSLPFDTTNPKKLKLDQMNKAYRFRNSKRMDISDEAVALVAGLLEPDPEARATIAEAASSNWMAMIPDMTQQTPLEKAAMEAHSALKTELRLHSLKRYVVPLLGETLEVSSEGLYAKVYYGLFVKSSSEDQFACKVINMRKAPKEFVSKFLPRELDILSKLCHPHIIHVNSIIQRNTKYLIFMRFAEKGDLLEYILANGEIDEHQCRLWFRQLALAIEYLHAVDISHRDIKCENILITNNMNIKLTDFGFARFTVDANRRPVTSNTYCGSFAYAPPEILMGRPYQPKPTDIWSMGVVLYVMLNKCMPFPNTNIKQLVKEQTKRAWTFRSKVQEVVSDEVRLLTARAIEPDVRKRVTIQQVLEDPWFDLEVGLKIKDRREQDALEVAIRLKDKIIPVGKRSKITTSRTKQITLLREEISDFTHNRLVYCVY